MFEFQVILLLMIAGAVVAMEIEDVLSSVIALGAVGIGLSLQFLLLKAPDLAITQLVVEIIALVILIKATIGARAGASERAYRPSWAMLLFGGVFACAFMLFAARALAELPPFGAPLMRMGAVYAREALRLTHAANIVSAIILDFRGYDTLGEASILFTAAVGVYALIRIEGRRK